MSRRRAPRTLACLLLFALACSGGGGGGGGCGGCGGCLAPIPDGGFPVSERKPSAATVKLSKGAFDTLQQEIGPLVQDIAGQNLAFDLPCTHSKQELKLPLVGGVRLADVYICDLAPENECAAPYDPAARTDPGNGLPCNAEASIEGASLRPVQQPNGPVSLEIIIQMKVKTGTIPLKVKVPLCGTFRCAVEYDSDDRPPTELPITARVHLQVDPTRGDILTFNVTVDDLTQAIDDRELKISSLGGNFCGLGCDLANLPFIKQMLFDQVRGMISRQINDAVDQFRCHPCEPGPCPGSSTCNKDQGVCYTKYEPNDDLNKDVRECPPALLGVEGRMGLGELLGSFGGPANAALDLALVAGGRDPDGKPTHRVQTGGLIVGMMGGSRSVLLSQAEGVPDRVPARAQCVPRIPWEPRPPATAIDFDTESARPGAGGKTVADYHFGFAVGDNFIDKLMYDAWDAGALCLTIDGDTVDLLSTGLFSTFLPSLGHLTQGENVPMAIVLRPQQPPGVVIGKGTTKTAPDGKQVPDDPLLTIEMKKFRIDFYAAIEERYSRLFSLISDVALPLSLDVSPAGITPVLGSLDAVLTNVEPANSEMLAEDTQVVASLIGTMIGFVQPLLGDAFSPIALPDLPGLRLDLQDFRGAIKYPDAPGHEHMAMFAKLTRLPPPPPGAPMTSTVRTEAKVVAARIPTVEQVIREGATPAAIVDVRAFGPQGIGFRGYEYAWRVDGGLWSTWSRASRLEIAPAVLRLQGRHRIEVRAREIGVPESVALQPAAVPFIVDYEPAKVSLELDPELDTVRTVAKDSVARDHELRFRYRVGTEGWSEWGDARLFGTAELAGRALEVEVSDLAGHVSSARLAALASADPARGSEERSAGGCAHAPASLFGLAALLLATRRRRPR